MGRPKTLRNRDVVPIIPKDQKNNGKHKSFEADDNNEFIKEISDNTVVVNEVCIDNNNNNNNTMVIDKNKPDELSSDHIEILKMKQIHENMVNSTNMKSKRRKLLLQKNINDNQLINSSNVDDELDISILNSISDPKSKLLKGNEFNDENYIDENDEIDDKNLYMKIDVRKSNSKRLDNIEVLVLDNDNIQLDPIQSFQIPTSVLQFNIMNSQKHNRIKYSSFIAQKKKGPSKLFKTK